MLRRLTNILTIVRDFLFSTFNKEFLIFLFFLVLSSAYWLMSVLNDTMEREIVVPVKLSDIPKNVIILGDHKTEVRAVIRDKGYTLASYVFGDHIHPVKVAFSTYARDKETCTVTAFELQKLISLQLYGSSKVVSVKPEKIEFKYNFGLHRKFPVKLYGTVRPSETYYLSRISFNPESVTVYGSARALDSIKAVYTTSQRIVNFSDTLQRTVQLRAIPAVKIVPAQTTMTLYPDIMTEAVTMVPITAINVPAGAVLRTFPAQAQVRYVIGASQYNSIDTSTFTVVADYESTENGTSPKCTLRLAKSPSIARNPVLLTTQVDYLIEQ